jgi:hypothetical protein
MAEDKDKIFHVFRKNVPYYNVGVRRTRWDTDGILLTNEFPTVRIEDEDLREFKLANKYNLNNGLIVNVDEEDITWDENNAVTDEQVDELLKNYAKLKSTLPTITSLVILKKILDKAEEQEKPKKTRSLIQARLDEIEPEQTDIEEMYRDVGRNSFDE